MVGQALIETLLQAASITAMHTHPALPDLDMPNGMSDAVIADPLDPAILSDDHTIMFG